MLGPAGVHSRRAGAGVEGWGLDGGQERGEGKGRREGKGSGRKGRGERSGGEGSAALTSPSRQLQSRTTAGACSECSSPIPRAGSGARAALAVPGPPRCSPDFLFRPLPPSAGLGHWADGPLRAQILEQPF